MQKRTPAAKLTDRKKGKKRKSSTSRRPAPELSPMDKLEASVQASQEERRRNPPKTDYVLPDGRMLSVPNKLLATEKDVLGMYEHLHEFCSNSLIHDFGMVYRSHNNPVDCLTNMYEMGCVSLGEMRAILQIPLQIRWLHEHLYRVKCWQIYPYRQFIVEFVEMLRFNLRQHGYVRPDDQPVIRHSHSIFPGRPKPDELPFAEDVIATSYEGKLTQDKVFLSEWEELRLKVSACKWAFARHQNWYLAFNSSGQFDEALTKSSESNWTAPSEKPGAVVCDEQNELKSALGAFCRRWALTHVGTPFTDDFSAGQVILRAERVDVFPMREDDSPVPNVLNPIGHDVRIPKYYAFSHIQEYYDRDFIHLKYVMQLTGNQRKAKYELSDAQKIHLLRNLKAILKRNKVMLPEIYRIQKSITGMTQGSLHKIGFARPLYMPSKALEKGRVKNMEQGELFRVILEATAQNKSDQRAIYRILSHFKINVDFLSINAER